MPARAAPDIFLTHRAILAKVEPIDSICMVKKRTKKETAKTASGGRHSSMIKTENQSAKSGKTKNIDPLERKRRKSMILKHRETKLGSSQKNT
jgi:hypothetical protein